MISNLSLEIVPSTADAAKQIMEWRNDPTTLAESFHREKKEWPAFYEEFSNEYLADSTLPCLFAVEGSKRVAFVRFRKVQDPSSQNRKVCDISINVAPSERGRGLGSVILKNVMPILCERGIEYVLAEVKKTNIASQKIFLKAGFYLLDEIDHIVEKTSEVVRVERYLFDVGANSGNSILDKSHPLKAMLFDLDGTLANSPSFLETAYFDFVKANNITSSHAEFVQLSGPSLREIIQILKEKYHLVPSVEDLHEQYLSILKPLYAEKIKPLMGAQDLLLQLQELHVPTALVTSAPRILVDIFLNTQNWQRFFKAIITGDDVKAAKPDPAIYLKALQTLSVPAAHAVVLEDSIAGVTSAAKAGIKVIGITSHNQERLTQAGACTVVSALNEVAPLIMPDIISSTIS